MPYWQKLLLPVLAAALLGTVGFAWRDRNTIENRVSALETRDVELLREIHEIHEDVRELRRALLGK